LKKLKKLNDDLFLVLIGAIFITVLIFVQLWFLQKDSSSYIKDYKGKFVNSAGEKLKAEITIWKDDPDSKWLEISNKDGRNVFYKVSYNKPKEALPQDIRFIDIDMSRDSYIVWIYQKDGSEMIKHQILPRMYFYLDSEITDLNEHDIYCINDIEKSNAFDSLPDADIHKAKWENYFSRLKQEYEESTDTSSKEDNV
jgi:hypothetical protein